MKPASLHFTPEQRKRIDAAVAVAEVETSAEIVPVVATASGRYDRAEDVAGLYLGLALMALTFFLLPDTRPEPGAWDWTPAWVAALLLVASVVTGFVVGAAVASRAAWLRRLFTPDVEMRQEVQRSAREAFFDRRVHHTASGGGVLIYVSLYERTAAVLADEAVLDKLGPDALVDLCDLLTGKLRDGADLTTALCDTIAATGDRLAGVLPDAPDDVNEIPDALVVVD